jgi:NAD(P) transhydrogenase
METKHYDLVVVGSGPAGEKGAAQAAYFGKRVALVEAQPFLGGAAAGTTVPSKTLRETALALSGLRARQLYGVDLSLKGQATVQDFLRHERSVKDHERKRVTSNLVRHNIDRYDGLASFIDGRNLQLVFGGRVVEQLAGDIILLATGSSPRRPDIFPEHRHIYDSDTILDLDHMPKRMVIVGAGVIGCEYACLFSALGVKVFLVNPNDKLMPFLDREISETLQKCMSQMGVELLLEEQVQNCDTEGPDLVLSMESGLQVSSDIVMLATGRNSNTGKLNLEAAGIVPGTYGRLVVDDNYQVINPETKERVPGVYAAGDVIGAPALASTSMEQARFAMVKAFDLYPYKDHIAPILPMGIYTIPECSGAGKTEEQCVSEGLDYVVGKAYYNENARGMIIGDQEGFLKLIFEFNDDIQTPMTLLGVHVIGEIASELLHIGLGALISKAGSNYFIDICFNYPTLGELYKYATYAAMGERARRIP